MTREEQEQRKIEEQNKKITETALLCADFLVSNASDIELSGRSQVSSSTVGRRLTNKNYVVSSYFMVIFNLEKMGYPKEKIPKSGEELFEIIAKKRQENLLRGKALGGQTTLLNHVYLKNNEGKFDGSTKLRLDVIYHSEESQYRFLIHAALTFRLHSNTLSDLFQMDEKELYEKLIQYANGTYYALMYLFYHDMKDQKVARKEFLNYYGELLNAIRNKDIDGKRRLISVISDKDALEFRKNFQEGNIISEEELIILLKYQLKYALTGDKMESIFLVERKNYQKRVKKLIEKHEDLRLDYENLLDYNIDKGKKGYYYGK